VSAEENNTQPEQEAHTRVPNLIYDIVLPLVTSAERDCLHYIVRRTYGFADPDGGRKARDTISLEQFEHGIVSGNYLLDLGTQLSRNTIRNALSGLEKKGLVEVRFSCTNCFWEQAPDHGSPEVADSTKSPACPRCRASLSRSWALAVLTPRKLLQLLNQYDKQRREWSWDAEAKRFRFFDPGAEKARQRSQEDLQAEAIRLRNMLWCPELIDQAIEKASKHLKSGKISLRRQVNNFYKPTWELQEEFPNPALIKYALQQTIDGPVFKGEKTHSWHRYALKVAQNNKYRFPQAGDPIDDNIDVEQTLRDKELHMREILNRAAQLNGTGEHTEARALLSDILSQVQDLAPLFEDDKQVCDRALRLAFKQGNTDFVGVKVDEYAPDYYPEWNADNTQVTSAD